MPFLLFIVYILYYFMKNLYKQLINDIAIKLNRKPIYVAHCIKGRYKAKSSEIPIFIKAFKSYGYRVSERDFLQGTRLSNNPLILLFQSMHTRPQHDQFIPKIKAPDIIQPLDKVLSVDI